MGLGRRASRDADDDRRSTRHRAREGDRRASPICRRRTRRTWTGLHFFPVAARNQTRPSTRRAVGD